MTPAFEHLQKLLKQLPGIGYRSAERIALHLLVERRDKLVPLMDALQKAAQGIQRCAQCGNISEGNTCYICAGSGRNPAQLCIVEQVPDLVAIERSGAYHGLYHVLHGKLSPMNRVGESELNMSTLHERLGMGEVTEVILALSNDIEGESTCHFLQEKYLNPLGVKSTRIGFGLPSGGGILYADAVTLKSALEGRRHYD
ncbi:MAG: recombination mediator RecR [Verrucomicrobiota bacterium]|nr:recombination mediator RecR [Verrucomicrobiota bacterium]